MGRHEVVRLADQVPYDGNAKKHTHEQIEAVKESIKQLGFGAPLVAWHNDDGRPEIVAGHARARAAQELGIESVPVVFRDDWTDAQRRAYTLADNQTTMMTGWDDDQLAYELDALAETFDMDDFGFGDLPDMDEIADQLGDEPQDDHEPDTQPLAERFGAPPFTVLDARSGAWQERKRAWLALGIRSELGRGAGGVPGGGAPPPNRAGSHTVSTRRLTYGIDARASAYRG